MKSPLLLLSFALLAGCAAHPEAGGTELKAMPDAASVTTSTLPDELSVAHPALLRAWQGKDPMAMRPYYADDAVVVTRTERYDGWAALHSGWLTPTLKRMSGFMAMPSTFTREGDTIREQGRYSFHVVQDGREQEVSGVYAQQWKRDAHGHWRVVAASVISD